MSRRVEVTCGIDESEAHSTQPVSESGLPPIHIYFRQAHLEISVRTEAGRSRKRVSLVAHAECAEPREVTSGAER